MIDSCDWKRERKNYTFFLVGDKKKKKKRDSKYVVHTTMSIHQKQIPFISMKQVFLDVSLSLVNFNCLLLHLCSLWMNNMEQVGKGDRSK